MGFFGVPVALARDAGSGNSTWPYNIAPPLGSDGMGAVYRARYTVHGTAKSRLVRYCGCQFEERCELGGSPELRDRIEFFERARERIGETPCRPWSEFLDSGIEIQIVNVRTPRNSQGLPVGFCHEGG